MMIERQGFLRGCPLNWIFAWAICLCFSLCSQLYQGRAGENTVVIGVWIWEGDKSADWFDRHNWNSGDLVEAPTKNINISFGPSRLIINDIPTDTYFVPEREAFLGADYSSPSLSMIPFDGPTTLTISKATYNVTLARVGRKVPDDYIPVGALQPSIINLCDGYLAGEWIVGDTAQAILNVCGQSRAGKLTFAKELGSQAILRIIEGSSFDTSQGVTIGMGELLVENHAVFKQTGGWTGVLKQLRNFAGSQFSVFQQLGLTGSIENAGELSVVGSVVQPILYIHGETVLEGGGRLSMSNGNAKLATGPTGGILVNRDNTILLEGGAIMDVPLRNQSLIEVEEGSFQVLQDIDNSLGRVHLKPRAFLDLGGKSLNGRVDIEEGGVIKNGILRSILNKGHLTVSIPGIHFEGTLTNEGVVGFNNQVAAMTMGIRGRVELRGGGEIQLMGGNSKIVGIDSESILVNRDNLIRGGSNASLEVALENHGEMRFEQGQFFVKKPMDNRDGIVRLGLNSFVDLGGTTLSGRIASEAGAHLMKGIIKSAATEGTVTVLAPGLSIEGTLTNWGTWRFSPTGFGHFLNVIDEVELVGGGNLLLDRGLSSLNAAGTNSVLVNRDNILRGGDNFQISVPLRNEHVLQVDSGILYVKAPINNSKGRTIIGAQSALDLGGNSLNGRIEISAGGSLYNGTITEAHLLGTLKTGVQSFGLKAAVTNAGSISVFANQSQAPLWIDGAVFLYGSGELMLPPGLASIQGTTDTASLSLMEGTLRGSGTIHVDVINSGIIVAESRSLVFQRRLICLDGARIEAWDGGSLVFSNPGPDPLLLPSGSVLVGDGEIGADVESRGTVRPGSTKGPLKIGGSLMLSGTYVWSLSESSGDRLAIAGSFDPSGATCRFESNGATPTEPHYVLAKYGDRIGGRFATLEGIPPGYAIDYAFEGNKVALVKRATSPFDDWSTALGLVRGLNDGPLDDPNQDGIPNIQHFAYGGSPVATVQQWIGPVAEIDSSVEGGRTVMTLPVRRGATFTGQRPMRAVQDGIVYEISADDDLVGQDFEVREVVPNTGAKPVPEDVDGDGAADWEYRSFEIQKTNQAVDAGFLIIRVLPE